MEKVSIIIPVYNEQSYIHDVIESVLAVDLARVGFQKEIIVIDDGSTDHTYDIASEYKNILLFRKKNGGKGSAVQLGIQKASGEWFLIQDADMEYNPQDYLKMLEVLNNNKNLCIAVYGSRILGQIEKNSLTLTPGRHPRQGYGPWFMNIVLSALTFILYQKLITDNLTAYKLYPSSILKNHTFVTSGFEGDHEITSLLLNKKIPIFEVPISYDPRTKSQGKKIKLKDGIIAIMTLLRCKFRRDKSDI